MCYRHILNLSLNVLTGGFEWNQMAEVFIPDS